MLRYAFLTGFPITINKPEILKWIWFESLETINNGSIVCISVSRDNGEITSTKSNVEIIFSKYHCHYGMVKCRQIVNFEETDTEWSTGKNYGFWVLRGIFKEYIKQNIIMAVLRKANSHSVAICRLIKKNQYRKRWSKEKNWLKLWFFSSCLVHMRF